MRKFYALVMVIIVHICGMVAAAAEQPEVTGEINIEESDQILVFKNYAIDVDFENKPMLVLFFDYTNFSSDAKNSICDFYITVYQNGVERNITFLPYLSPFQDEYDNSVKNIKNGVTLPTCVLYSLEDTNSPVEVQVKDFRNYDETAGRNLEIDISKYVAQEAVEEDENEANALLETQNLIETENIKTYEEEYIEMSENYSSLQSEYEALQAEYNALLEEKEILETEIEDRTSEKTKEEQYATSPYFTYSGAGDNIVSGLTTEYWSYAHIVCNNDAYFSVKAYYDDTYDLLVNTTEPYSGDTLIYPDKEYTFEVDSEGSWSIEIYEMMSTTSDSFEGSGDYVTPVFVSSSDVYEINHNGAGHFSVKAWNDYGYDLLVNTTDDTYSGKVMFKNTGEYGFFEINSEGPWSISPVK